LEETIFQGDGGKMRLGGGENQGVEGAVANLLPISKLPPYFLWFEPYSCLISLDSNSTIKLELCLKAIYSS